MTEYKGYQLHHPTSGGKAGKGCNVTGSLQIRKDNCIVKQYRFKVTVINDLGVAIEKAMKHIDGLIYKKSPKDQNEENSR